MKPFGISLETEKREQRLVLLGILALGLLLRVAHLVSLSNNYATFDYPTVDAAEYLASAEYYLTKSWLGPLREYMHPPFYAYFVATIRLIFGESLDAIRTIQILLDVISIGLVYAVGARVFSQRAALVAAGIYAIYTPAVHYCVEIAPPTTLSFLALLAIAGLLSYLRQKQLGQLVLSGLALGLLIVHQTTFLVWLPIFAFAVWRTAPANSDRKRKLRPLLCLLVIALTPASAASARNLLHAGGVAFVSTNAGINLYIGNNPEMRETVAAMPGIGWWKLRLKAFEEQRTESFAQENRFWFGKVASFAANQPLQFVRGTAVKSAAFFNAYEIPRNFDYYAVVSHSVIDALPLISLGLLMPFGLAGMLFSLISRQPDPTARLLTGLFFAFSASIIAAFVAGRYRMPVVPLLAIFAGNSIVELQQSAASKDLRRIVIRSVSVVLLFGLVQHRFFAEEYPYEFPRGLWEVITASAYFDRQEYGTAAELLKAGLSSEDANVAATAHVWQARILIETGRVDEAQDFFERASAADPLNFEAPRALGIYARKRGDLDACVTHLSTAREVSPCYAKTYLNFADCYLVKKDDSTALSILDSYSERCPSPHPEIYSAIGKIHFDNQRYEPALEAYELATRYRRGLDPSPAIYAQIGAIHFAQKRYGLAQKAWRRGLELDPDHEPIRHNLAIVDQLSE